MVERLKVSMITICYNAEKTIAKTIESVLSQDYENLEYVRSVWKVLYDRSNIGRNDAT